MEKSYPDHYPDHHPDLVRVGLDHTGEGGIRDAGSSVRTDTIYLGLVFKQTLLNNGGDKRWEKRSGCPGWPGPPGPPPRRRNPMLYAPHSKKGGAKPVKSWPTAQKRPSGGRGVPLLRLSAWMKRIGPGWWARLPWRSLEVKPRGLGSGGGFAKWKACRENHFPKIDAPTPGKTLGIELPPPHINRIVLEMED